MSFALPHSISFVGLLPTTIVADFTKHKDPGFPVEQAILQSAYLLLHNRSLRCMRQQANLCTDMRWYFTMISTIVPGDLWQVGPKSFASKFPAEFSDFKQVGVLRSYALATSSTVKLASGTPARVFFVNSGRWCFRDVGRNSSVKLPPMTPAKKAKKARGGSDDDDDEQGDPTVAPSAESSEVEEDIAIEEDPESEEGKNSVATVNSSKRNRDEEAAEEDSDQVAIMEPVGKKPAPTKEEDTSVPPPPEKEERETPLPPPGNF